MGDRGRRLTWLLLASALFVAAGRRLLQYEEFVRRVPRSNYPAGHVPPTLFSQHYGVIFALVCLGCVGVLMAFRKPG